MAASQPNRFDENLELAERARPNAPDVSATPGTKAPIIPIESAVIESAREASARHNSRQWVRRNFVVLGFDLMVMAAAIALLPIGAIVLVRFNKVLPRSLHSTATGVPVQGRPRSVPTAQDQTVPASQASVVSKADHPGVVSDVRYTSDSVSAFVFVDLDQEAKFEVHRIGSPERIYLDLQNTKLAPALVGKEIQAQDRFLRALRVGEHERQTTRIVLATAQICDYSVTWVPNSSQLRIELREVKAQARKDEPDGVAKK